jgi:Sulfotransferase family
MQLSSTADFSYEYRFIRAIDRVAQGLGFLGRPLRAEELIETACRRQRRDDFGDWSFLGPLCVLLRSYEADARLTVFGRLAAKWDMLRLLSNLLRLRGEEERDARVLDESVRQPVFILGLPRSGTTFLHNLLAQDSANLVPRAWQTIFPYPGGRARGNGDRRCELVARRFAAFVKLVPELPSLHPLDARGAQECTDITAHVMRSMRFDMTHHVPTYADWLEREGHLEAYRFHKRFLQHLQHQQPSAGGELPGAERWVLKSPDHIFAFDALSQVYPDARFVFVHRDPMKVLPSVARLTEILRRPFARLVDPIEVGRQASTRWARGASLLVEAADRLQDAPQRIFHLHYQELVRSPVEVIGALYGHFGMAISDLAREAIRQTVAERPHGGYGHNIYHWEDYGLDPAVEERNYRAYMARFRIASEAQS